MFIVTEYAALTMNQQQNHQQPNPLHFTGNKFESLFL